MGAGAKVSGGFTWTRQRIEAARLIAEDELMDTAICEKLGVKSRNTIYMWRQAPEFAARVKQLRMTWEHAILNRGICNKANRARLLQGMHDRAQQIVEDRAKKYSATIANGEEAGDPVIAGGRSGFIAVENRIIKTHYDGENTVEISVEKAEFDSALYREMRATLAQAAEETGQSVSKHEITGANGGPLEVNVGVLDDIVSRVEAAEKADLGGGPPSRESSPTGDDGQ